MAILSDKKIRTLCNTSEPLIADAPDFEQQLQPAGFDVTVRSIVRMHGNSQIGGPYRSKVAAETEMDLREGRYLLDEGPYLVYINEYTRIPLGISATVFPRSTAFRCGCILQSGLWDSGFCGRGRLGIFVPSGIQVSIEHNAPIAQLVFLESPDIETPFQFNQFYR